MFPWSDTDHRPPWARDPHAGQWRAQRRHFARRIAVLVVFGVVSMFILGGVTARLILGDDFAGGRADGPPAHALLLLIPIGFVTFVIVRGLKRTAAPIGAVMDAADRIADGDYAVRLRPEGSSEVRHLMATFNAMTTRLQTNEEQRRMLLADIAHELRNPLAIIRGNVEGMIDGIYTRDDGHLDLLLDETEHMNRLLDDLQTISMADAGVLRLHPEPIMLRAFLADIVDAFELRATSAGLTLTAEVRVDGEMTVDPVRIRQVVENLVINALRHTPAGGSIQVTGKLNPRMVEIVVADNGAGIAPDMLPHIFDRFTKAADSGGSGLGLAIARRLVARHGGTIQAESAPGQGTRMRIRLPLPREG